MRGEPARDVDGAAHDGPSVGAHFGVTEAVVGMVIAQVVATVLLYARRRSLRSAASPSARRAPRRASTRRAPVRRPVEPRDGRRVAPLARSPRCCSASSRSPSRSGYFRIAQAPMQGLASLSAPARLILLTEQTRDWSRGAFDVVFAGVRRFTIGAALADGDRDAAAVRVHARARSACSTGTSTQARRTQRG